MVQGFPLVLFEAIWTNAKSGGETIRLICTKSPVAKREKRENQFPIPLGLGFAKLANHVRFVAWPAERPMEPYDV